jgi:two-component system LytT family response regulator/two-component system response regulator AlgR
MLRIAIAEDEPLARTRLARLLRGAGCEVLAELEDGHALMTWLAGNPALDAIFLDIRMPGPSGIEVLAELPKGLRVVFVTSNPEHAVAAFEHAAVDYLVKPVTAERLAKTLERLAAGAGKAADSGPPSGSHAVLRFPVKAGDGKLLLDLRKVTYFEVVDQVVWAMAGGKRCRTTWTSLSEVEGAFPQTEFLRLQRHVMIRPESVLGLRTLSTGRRMVMLSEGAELEASRSAAHHLKERLGL